MTSKSLAAGSSPDPKGRAGSEGGARWLRRVVSTPPAQRPRSELAPRVISLIEGVRWLQVWFFVAVIGGFIAVFGLPGVQEFPPYRIDFDVYRTGGQLVLNGENLYGELPPLALGDRLPFTYPPIAALLFTIFAVLPLAFGSVLITLASGVALWFSAAWVARFYWRLSFLQATQFTLPVMALGMWLGPVRETLSFGQVNLLLMVATIIGLTAGLAPWKPRLRTPWWGPVLVGFVASIKLTPLVFGLFYLVRRDVRGVVGMVLGVLLGTGLGFAFLRTDSIEYWTRTLSDTGRIGGLAFASNQGFNGFLQRIFAGEAPSQDVWKIAVVALILLVAFVAWRLVNAGRNIEAMLAVAMVSLLASPVSWSHHWVWTVPALVSLAWWALPMLRGDRNSVAATAETTVGAGIQRLAQAASIVALCVFYLTPHWWVPRRDNVEYSWTVLEHVIGNFYLWWAVLYLVFLVVIAVRARSRG